METMETIEDVARLRKEGKRRKARRVIAAFRASARKQVKRKQARPKKVSK